MKVDIKSYKENIYQIDVMMEEKKSRMACYYIDSSNPLLIEVGPSNSFPYLIDGLASIGVSDIKRSVITHLHLDHVGGIGHLVEKFNHHNVYVHELGQKHLANPERLWDAVSYIYGESWLIKNWGKILPVPKENIFSLSDGERLSLGNNRYLTSIYSPGHAKHHYSFYDEHSGTIFMGDTLGLIYPHGDFIQPNLPPPEFNKEIIFNTLENIKKLDLSQIAIAHFGIHKKPYDLLNECMEAIEKWLNFVQDLPNMSNKEAANKLKLWVKKNYTVLGVDQETMNTYISNGNFLMQIEGIKNYLVNKD